MGRGINNLREEFRMSGATKDSFRCVESSSFGRRHHRFRSFVIIASSAAAFNLNLRFFSFATAAGMKFAFGLVSNYHDFRSSAVAESTLPSQF